MVKLIIIINYNFFKNKQKFYKYNNLFRTIKNY